jgi:predicted TIM-barrel fold metal-dependent hydrolase
MHDMHTHFIPPMVLDWVKDNKQYIHAKWEAKSPDQEEFLTINNKWGFELKESFINPERFLREQAQAGVNHSLVSPIPQLFMYEFSPSITTELCSVYNEALAQWVQEHPQQISGLATLPMNDPIKAANELRKAVGNGLKGAIIGTGSQGNMLTEDCFIPFWEEAQALRAILFIHPLLAEDPRLKKRMMPNLIGVPWETTVCATDILLSGLLDRYPDVKILLAHGGGYLPYQIGRLNTGFEKWQAVRSSLQAPPIEYLGRFWFDNVLWNSEALDYLISIVGEERVVPGSDYPFDLSTFPPASISEKGVKSLLQL